MRILPLTIEMVSHLKVGDKLLLSEGYADFKTGCLITIDEKEETIFKVSSQEGVKGRFSFLYPEHFLLLIEDKKLEGIEEAFV